MYPLRNVVPLRRWVLSAGTIIARGCFKYGHAHWALMIVPGLSSFRVVYFVFHPPIRLHRVGKFADSSYGTYLYAFSIQQLIVFEFGPRLTPWTLSVSATVLPLFAGIASWHESVKPFWKLKNNPQEATS